MPLDPRTTYKAFMTEIVFPKEPKCDSEPPVTKPPSSRAPVPESISKSYDLTNFELFNSRVGSEEEKATETLRCLWPFFKLSRCIGMCPVARRGNRLQVPRFYHPSWILTYVALVVQIIMVGNSVKKIRGVDSTNAGVKQVNNVIYYSHTLLNCLYMSWKVKELPGFLVSCKRIEILCKKHQLVKDGLVRDCWLLFLFFSITQGIGNILFYVSLIDKGHVRSIPQFFQSFNSEFIGHWGSYYSGIYFSFAELYCDMGWTFADILLSLLSVVLARFFTRLNAAMVTNKSHLSLKKIEELRIDHREICGLVHICNNLFSPLVLLTYLANVAYLFTRLYTGLSDELKDSILTVRIESVYAFFFQIFIKILIPSYLGSRLHEKAHEGLKLIHNWPSTVESPDCKYRLLVVARFVSQLVTTPVGISGCGYFLISKSFMVTLISALVTYEVIILQFQGASLKSE